MALFDRVKNIITAPVAEWPVVAGESTSIGAVYSGYCAPLAAIAQIAIFGGGALANRTGAAVASGAVFGVIAFFFDLAMIYFTAYVATALANPFGVQRDLPAAFRWAAYSRTPYWIGCILALVPNVGWVGGAVGGAYSLVLFWLGTVPMTRVPADRATPYFGTITAAYLIAYASIFVILTRLVELVFAATLSHHG